MHEHRPFIAAKPVQRDHRHLRPSDPGRLEVGPVGCDQQHRQACDLLDRKVEQLARGRIDPMQILEIINTGCRRASAWSCRSSAANVRSFLRCGLRSSGGKRSPPESDNISAISERSPGSAPSPSSLSSLSSLIAAVSSRVNPAARYSWPIKG